MNPIQVWGQQATHWTQASVRWLDRWRKRGDIRFDTAASGSLRRWLGYVAIAAAGVCVAAIALHSLLLIALRSEPALGWLAVAAVAATAVVLLVLVVRDTVVSFAAPPRRQAHLIALLMSTAALVAGVQACGAATVAAAGRTVSLWQAEQLYTWRLADAVPLLAIPRRLEWSQPVVPPVPGDRAIQVAFLVALIVPVARMVLAIYHLTGGSAVEGSARTKRILRSSTLTLFGVRLRRSSILASLVTAAGFVTGGLGAGLEKRVAAGSGLIIVGAVAVATLGGLLLAALLWIVMSLLTAVWTPIADGPWMQLAVAAGLVWIDTPVRRVLLSSVDRWGAPGKVVVTLCLWAMLTVLLLPVWVDPQLPESLLALGLLVGFAGAGAPGRERLLSTIGWTPGGFALGRALATAAACLTGAYLVRLLSRSPARAANAGLPVGGSVDLRRELGGYVYVGVQVVTAAAGALLLLHSLGAVGTTPSSTAMDAPRSMLAITWHVADSIPGPDLPASAGWRPAIDFTGPWAGSVVVATLCTIIVVVVFPMTRATVRWAKLKAGPLVQDRPLAEVPSALLADLESVRTFLTAASRIDAEPDEYDEILASQHEVEQRLTLADLDRAKLRDLLGEESPTYWAADNAIAQATDAYRTVVRKLNRHSLQWSPWPVRGTSEAEAVAAIDVYAAAVDRWQMGADVVTEIESRVHELESRERSVWSRERDLEAREYRIDAWERGLNAREHMLDLHEAATRARQRDVEERERDLEARGHALDEREHGTEARERELGHREQSVTAREENADLREQSIRMREQNAETRERNAAERELKARSREESATVRHHEIDARERWIEAREQNAEIREQSVVTRERKAAEREQNIEAREREVAARGQQHADTDRADA